MKVKLIDNPLFIIFLIMTPNNVKRFSNDQQIIKKNKKFA